MRISIPLLLISVLTLSGCGQKGPLRLPDDVAPKPPVVQPSAPSSTPSNSTSSAPARY